MTSWTWTIPWVGRFGSGSTETLSWSHDEPVVEQGPLLDREAVDLARDEPFAEREVEIRVLVEREGGKRYPRELLPSAAGELHEGSVHLGQAPVGAVAEVDEGDADRGVLERAAKARIGLVARLLGQRQLGHVLTHADDAHDLAAVRVDDRLALAAQDPLLAVAADDPVLEAEGSALLEARVDHLADELPSSSWTCARYPSSVGWKVSGSRPKIR